MADVAELELKVSGRKVATETRKAKKELKSLGTQADVTSAKMQRGFKGAAASAAGLKTAIVGIGSAMAVRAGVRTIAQFGQEMSGVEALTMATEEQMKSMRATARELGKETVFSASEAAQGMQFMAMAGFEVEEITAALPGTLDLAAAGMIDLGTAADIATNVLSGFGMEADEMGRVGDVLAGAASMANTTVFELGDAMKFAAPVAKGLGIELEELTAGINILSNAGIKGGEAGTGMRRVMLSLVDPSTEAQKAIADLGLSMEDVDPIAKGLTGALENLIAAGLDPKQAATIFGLKGISSFLALAPNIGQMKEMNEELLQMRGISEKMAKIRLDNLAGDWKLLKSAITEVVLASGEDGLEGSMRDLVQSMTKGVRWIGDNWNWLRDAVLDVMISIEGFGDELWTALEGGVADMIAFWQVSWYGAKGIVLSIFASVEETFGKLMAKVINGLKLMVDQAARVASVLPGGMGERLQAVSGQMGAAAAGMGGPSAARAGAQAAFGTAEGIMGAAEAAQAQRHADLAERQRLREQTKAALGGVADGKPLDLDEALDKTKDKTKDLDDALKNLEQRNAFDVMGESLQSFVNGFDQALTRFGDFQQRLSDMGEGIALSIDANLTDALTDFVMGTKSAGEAFRDFAQQMIADLIRIMIQQLVVRSLMRGLGSIGGFGAAHSGGIAGGPLQAHPGAKAGDFSGARHFQGGGIAGDEVPIVAHRGEGIFTEEQMEALGQAINGGQNQQRPVEIINVADPAMVDERIAANPDATLNVINRNRQSVRRMLGMGG